MHASLRIAAVLISVMVLLPTLGNSYIAAGEPRASDTVPSSDAEYGLTDTTHYTVNGEVVDGVCLVSPRPLSLAPDEFVVEGRVVSVDYETCSAEMVEGTPVGQLLSVPEEQPINDEIDLVGEHADLDFCDETSHIFGGCIMAAPTTEAGSERLAVREGAGYTIAKGHNSDHAKVNHNKALLKSYTYNGSCVRSSDGWGKWWWHGEWEKDFHRTWYSVKTCSDHTVMAESRFRVKAIVTCGDPPQIIEYDDVYVSARPNGDLVGGVDHIIIDQGFGCRTKHGHWRLVRTL